VSECDREAPSGEAMTRNRVEAPQEKSFYCNIFMSVGGLKGCFDLLNWIKLLMENKGSNIEEMNYGLAI
jgi:hypothetical protein